MNDMNNIGRQIGRYKIIEEIGRGGMAVVYRALDTGLKREVALKLLHPHLAAHRESRERFKLEAHAVARLKHPSVLEIYDYSADDGEAVYLVTELIEGTTLRLFLDSLDTRAMSAEGAALIIRQVAQGLGHAHEHGIVHRDVKPENILISGDGDVKLSDFGIAHLAGVSQMTATGQILGSPAYMSPEHVELIDLDARADIFSLGTVLYEMTVGRQPFAGNNPHAVLKRIVEADYDDPLRVNAAIGHHVAVIVRRCLKPLPDDRYSSANDMVVDLDKALDLMEIDPAQIDLKPLLEDSCGWDLSRRPTIISRTLDFGLAARRAHCHPEAMDHFNRVLTLEPGNDRALSALAGMNRRRRMRRVFERTAFIAAVFVGLFAGGWALLRPDDTDSFDDNGGKTGLTSSDAGQSASVINEAYPNAESVKTGPFAPGSVRPLASKQATHNWKQKRKVVFTPYPLTVDISVDNNASFTYGPSTRTGEMSVGNHTITFIPRDKKRFAKQTWKIYVPPGSAPFQFRERLRWQAARLAVRSNVNGAVTIPGRVTAKTNRQFDISIKNGPQEKVSVLVSAAGYVPKTQQVTISAGELAETNVTLDRE
jgi:eukaryotic-like serine/threonine-protein kinase